MECVTKMFRKPEEENKTLKILLKIFLVAGIVASACVVAKLVYDKYKKSQVSFDDEDCFDDYCDSLLDDADAAAEKDVVEEAAEEECGDCTACGLCEDVPSEEDEQ